MRGSFCIIAMRVMVKVISNAPRTELRTTMADGTLKIAVAAIPEKGKANEELIRFLSKHFHVPKDCVTIERGLTSNKKIINIYV